MLGVFRHALIFGLGPVLQKGASLVLLPLYTHHLSPADYGEIELLTLLVGLFVVVFGFEYRQGYIQALNRGKGSAQEARVISASVALFSILALLGTLCFWFALPLFSDTILEYRLSWEYAAVLTVGLFADIMNFLLSATAQARLWSARMVTLSLVQFIFGTSLSVYLIIVMDMGPIGLFAGNAVGSLLMMAVLLYLIRSDLGRPCKVRETIRPILTFSLPLFVGALVYFVLRQVDRIVISEYLTLDDLGLYSMSSKLSALLMTFMFLPFIRSFDVWRFRFYEEGGRTDEVARIYRIFIVGIAIAGMVLATFGADIFVLLADKRFEAAMALLPLLNAVVMLQCCYSITSSAFYVSGATGLWLRILASGAVVQVAGSIILVQSIGVAGAAVSMLCANLIIYLIALRLAPKYWDVPYQHGRVIIVIGIATALSYVRTLWPRDEMIFNLGLNTVLLIAFVACVFGTGALTVAEVKRLRPFVREKIRSLSSKLLNALRPAR